MANLCDSKLRIYTRDGDLVKLLEKAYEGDLGFFETTLPFPRDMEEKERNAWNMNHWGTSCNPDVYNFNITPIEGEPEAHEIVVRMTTRWSPPVEWCSGFAELYPDSTFDLMYCEPGIGFAGIWSSVDGSVNYDLNNSDDLENLDNDLREEFMDALEPMLEESEADGMKIER